MSIYERLVDQIRQSGKRDIASGVTSRQTRRKVNAICAVTSPWHFGRYPQQVRGD